MVYLLLNKQPLQSHDNYSLHDITNTLKLWKMCLSYIILRKKKISGGKNLQLFVISYPSFFFLSWSEKPKHTLLLSFYTEESFMIPGYLVSAFVLFFIFSQAFKKLPWCLWEPYCLMRSLAWVFKITFMRP